jgi:hypothetical protein
MYRFQNCDDIPCDENAGLNTKDARGCVGVCVSGLGGWRVSYVWTPSEFSSFIEPDSFGIILFQPKIFRSKVVDFKSFKSNGLAIYVSRINSPKIFRSKVVDFKNSDSGHPPNHISKTNRSKIFR